MWLFWAARTSVKASILLIITSPHIITSQSICQVDPTGDFNMAHTTIADAISNGACDQPGSLIEIYCPVNGCEHGRVDISSKTDIRIVSAEAYHDGYGPVTIKDTSGSGVSVLISDSDDIVFESILKYESTIEVIDSRFTLIGSPSINRYSQVSATDVAIYAKGDSFIEMIWILMSNSPVCLKMEPAGSPLKAPVVNAAGISAAHCGEVVHSTGSPGPRLRISSDFSSTVQNYVMNNIEGFRLSGETVVNIDHTIFSGNMRSSASRPVDPVLFDVSDAASLTIRNGLIYDNDTIENPGVAVPWSSNSCSTCCDGNPCEFTTGHILKHSTSNDVTLQATTVVDNQNEFIIDLDASGGGGLLLDHVLFNNNWGKVLKCDSSSGCSKVTNIGSLFWDNYIDVECDSCALSFQNQVNPLTVYGSFVPDNMSNISNFMDPFYDLYTIDIYETSAPLPSDLFTGGINWGVDGVSIDTAPLSTGYHNPLAIISDITAFPTSVPSTLPSLSPSDTPSISFSDKPTILPSDKPSVPPSEKSSSSPSYAGVSFSDKPSKTPSLSPSDKPSISFSDKPTIYPSVKPSVPPSDKQSKNPSLSPSDTSSIFPSGKPNDQLSDKPSKNPSLSPSDTSSISPSDKLSVPPSDKPSKTPSLSPSDISSISPSDKPSGPLSDKPSKNPSLSPSDTPSISPSDKLSVTPSYKPSKNPSSSPSDKPIASHIFPCLKICTVKKKPKWKKLCSKSRKKCGGCIGCVGSIKCKRSHKRCKSKKPWKKKCNNYRCAACPECIVP